jgi:hypothetical protein
MIRALSSFILVCWMAASFEAAAQTKDGFTYLVCETRSGESRYRFNSNSLQSWSEDQTRQFSWRESCGVPGNRCTINNDIIRLDQSLGRGVENILQIDRRTGEYQQGWEGVPLHRIGSCRSYDPSSRLF